MRRFKLLYVLIAILLYLLIKKLIPDEGATEVNTQTGADMQAATIALDTIREAEGLSSTTKGKNKYFSFPSLALKDTKIYAYYDSGGLPTIGWGTTHYKGGKPVQIGDSITKSEADLLLYDEFSMKFNAIKAATKVSLSDNQLAALTSFCYNIGRTALFNSTLWKLLQKGTPLITVANEFDKWIYDNGKIVQGLKNRRAKEKKLFLS